MKPLLYGIIAAGLLATGNVCAEDEDVVRVQASASTSVDELLPGSQAIMSVTLNLIPGNHANSNRPQDPELVPTTLFPAEAKDVSWGRVRYPKPTEVIEWYSIDPLSVFENGAVIQALFTVSEDTEPGELELGGTLRVQVCDDEMCYPPERLSTSVTVKVSSWDDE